MPRALREVGPGLLEGDLATGPRHVLLVQRRLAVEAVVDRDAECGQVAQQHRPVEAVAREASRVALGLLEGEGLTTLVPGPPGDTNGRYDAFVRDASADGNLVAFNSYDTDLVNNDGADQEGDLFIRNMTTGKTVWLSPGLPAGADPAGVVISPDGQWVSSRWSDGSLHLTRVNTRVTTTVVAEGYSQTGSFSSRRGRFVFVSHGMPYVRNLATGATTAINTPTTGGSVGSVSISGNGQFAAYDWLPDDGSPSVIYRVAL